MATGPNIMFVNHSFQQRWKLMCLSCSKAHENPNPIVIFLIRVPYVSFPRLILQGQFYCPHHRSCVLLYPDLSELS